MAVTIYHNPRCSKSRQTLELLEEKGIKPEIIEYLLSPPSADELKNILNILGISARELMRKKEAAYHENGLDDGNLSEDELVDAIIKNPILIERPIVVSKGKAAIGRPPENVLAVI
jgi:arsenate reductase